jgi:hypothetical protein
MSTTANNGRTSLTASFNLRIFKTVICKSFYPYSPILLRVTSILLAFLSPMFPIFTVSALYFYPQLHFSVIPFHSNFRVPLFPLYWFIGYYPRVIFSSVAVGTDNTYVFPVIWIYILQTNCISSINTCIRLRELRTITKSNLANQVAHSYFTLWNFFSWCLGLFLLSPC